MKSIPDYIVKDLLRLLPVLIENVNLESKSTRVQNAVRLVKNIIKKLLKLNDYGKRNNSPIYFTYRKRWLAG